jgi:hypothetical protein
MDTEHAHSAHPELNHETTDVNLTGITRIAIVSLLVIVAILVFVYFFEKGLAYFLPDTTRTPAMANWKPTDTRTPKVPLVITDEPGLLRQLHAREDETLHHYAWIDKGKGLVRVPIDRALEMVASNPKLLAPQGAASAAPPAAPPAPAPTPAPAPAAGK